MSKLPAIQFYPGDWRKDPGIQALDYEARGVWFEILLLMHESSDRGRLLLNNNPMPIDALARILGIPEANAKQIVSKIEAYGVASRGADGALENRRMMRDEGVRQARAKAGRKGGRASKPQANGKQTASKGYPLHEDEDEVVVENAVEVEVPAELFSLMRGGDTLWAVEKAYALVVAAGLDPTAVVAARKGACKGTDRRYWQSLPRWLEEVAKGGLPEPDTSAKDARKARIAHYYKRQAEIEAEVAKMDAAS